MLKRTVNRRPDGSLPTRFAVAAGAAVLAGAATLAAIGADTLPAAASTASQDIHRVPCTGATFNVYYRTNSVACYEGSGELPVRLYPVHQMTTGENAGYFSVIVHGHHAISNFNPREIISFTAFPARLILIDIIST
jgi:hypothetical protein